MTILEAYKTKEQKILNLKAMKNKGTKDPKFESYEEGEDMF
jgi:hypothetical protein